MREPFYLHKLKETLAGRQRQNPAYSLRAFAKLLEIDSSNLSGILKEKRGLPVKRAARISKKLGLPPIESALFISSAARKQTQLDSIKVDPRARNYLFDDKFYRVISEWEYYAFLQLLSTRGFSAEIGWIAKRLGVKVTRAQTVVDDLLRLEFIREDSARGFVRTTPSLETSEDVVSQALRKSHEEALDLGKEKLESVPVNLRDFSSVTMAIDTGRLPEAKAVIREFQEKLHALMSPGAKDEVYQFNCQFFPLTKVSER